MFWKWYIFCTFLISDKIWNCSTEVIKHVCIFFMTYFGHIYRIYCFQYLCRLLSDCFCWNFKAYLHIQVSYSTMFLLTWLNVKSVHMSWPVCLCLLCFLYNVLCIMLIYNSALKAFSHMLDPTNEELLMWSESDFQAYWKSYLWPLLSQFC